MWNRDRHRTQLERELENAEGYEQWLGAAEALDELDGLLAWRESGDSELLHESLLREHLQKMREYRHRNDADALTRILRESLYRHLGELSDPALYGVARSGPKYLVTEFLDEVEQAMDFICDHPVPHVTAKQKLRLFLDAERVYGRPALVLSGGAAFGIYHLGVTRALWMQGLLPEVIAGSSMGAIVAASICNRNHTELETFFLQPDRIHRNALSWLPPGRLWRTGHAMDQEQLHEHIRTNVGSTSFLDAFRHSGRILNISVSPTRTRQKPRLLSELASPEVLIDYAVLASCAIPGIYPPVTLQASGGDGPEPYMPTERWIDGSVHGDLPLQRMARLHNVNKTIVSQANPHVLPFIRHHQQRGPRAFVKRAATSVAHAQLASALWLTRESSRSSTLRPLLEQAHAMATQRYLGDINIHFPFRPTLYRKVVSNPSLDDLHMYIRLGEQATWPQLAMVRDQTRVNRAFARCIARLRARADTRPAES